MSSSPTPREKRRAKRLRNIRNAALDLVIDAGVDGFSVHKLAARVDLTPGALYRYFDGRDEILIAVQVEVLEGFGRYLEAVLQGLADARPLLRIVGMCRAYLALGRLQPERFRLIAQLVAEPTQTYDDETAEPALSRAADLLGQLAQLFWAAEDAGVLDAGDAGRRAVVCWSSVQALPGKAELTRLAPQPVTTEELFKELLGALLRGWGADPDAVGAALLFDLDDTTLEAALEEE